MVKVNLVRPKRLESVSFTRQDMQKIGIYARQQITERVERGLGVDGRQMKPLSRKYAAKKTAIGQPPMRNMMFSGSMLGSMDVVDVGDGRVTIGFDRAAELAKAEKNQDRQEWFGLDKNSDAKVSYFAERILQTRLAKQK